MSHKSIRPPALSKNSLAPALNHVNTKWWVNFNGNCLKQDEVTLTHKLLLNFYIVYETNI